MEKLFGDFAPASAADWKARLEKDLKGITFEQLSQTDRNGMTIHPFYTGEDLDAMPAPVRQIADWSICSRIRVTDPVQANKEALEHLNNGASGLIFLLQQDTDLSLLLQEIALPYIYTCFILPYPAPAFTAQLRQYITQRGWDAGNMPSCFICYDAVGNYIGAGAWQTDREQDCNASFQGIAGTQTTICTDASLYLEAGATTVYELACTLAQVNEYLHLLEEQKKTADLSGIHITLAVDTSFFEQIAKMRALRITLQQLAAEYGTRPVIHLHAVTANLYRSPFDRYSNLLRDTIAGMAAVAGGCDSLYIQPFDADDTGDFGNRMSRNQQLIFKEESYLDKVADVAAGSYYIETLTEQLAAGAWEQFKIIEQDGGLIASAEKGIIGEHIARQAKQLIQEYKEGKRVLIGVNKFINAQDAPQPAPAEPAGTKGLQPLSLAAIII